MESKKEKKIRLEKATKEIIEREGVTPTIKDINEGRNFVSSLTNKQRAKLIEMIAKAPRDQKVDASKKFMRMLQDGSI